MKKFKRIAALMLTVCFLCGYAALPVSAASNKVITRSYDALSCETGLRALNFYGRDSFRITYDGRRVVSCVATQSKRDLNSGMYGQGGIRLKKKTANKWTYESVWNLNCRLMPRQMQTLAKKYAPELLALQKVGTILRVTTTYEVNANGTLKRTYTAHRWFTSIARYKKQIDNLFRY